MDIQSFQDRELITKLKAGSEEAFNLLFYKYERKLYAFSLSILPSREDAEEVVQEVFYRIWKKRELLDEQLSFKAFIFTIAKNYIYNLLSKRVSETAYKHYYLDKTSNQVNSAEETWHFHDLKNTIEQMVSKMPDKRKQVFTMSRFQGLTNREIAEQLNLSLSTVENHINKCLKALKQQLHLHDTHLCLLFIYLWC